MNIADAQDAGEQGSLWWPILLVAATTLLLMAAAVILWKTGDDTAQGTSLALVGAATTHLLKETGTLLRKWS